MDTFRIGDRSVGKNCPVYVIAELSANHGHNFEQAVQLVKAAKDAGADAIKLQTYTPDTITIDCDNEFFRITDTIWKGRTLYELYREAYTPWEWQPKLKQVANDLEMELFSTPFDLTAVDFLEKMDVPAYKISSFEVIDVPLIQYVARTGKPMIISVGTAILAEIEEAIGVARQAGCREIALLKCTSAYPAPSDDMNLKTIPHMLERFGIPIGLSDHTLGITTAIAAVALGATIIEKHFTLSRATLSPDSAFSIEPKEFKALIQSIRETEKALGEVSYQTSASEIPNRTFRRSLFVVNDIAEGEMLASDNVRSIRPGHGLRPKHLPEVIGRRAACFLRKGTPLDWSHVK